MIKARGYAAQSPSSPLAPFSFERREVGPKDVLIEISHCGICHSDIHQARDEWGGSTFPMVPGHEIVGRVTRVGAQVAKLKVGDLAGVGCMVDSCRKCENCRLGEEQMCTQGCSFTYNGTEQDKKTVTQGGYADKIVVDEAFTLKIPASIPPERAAPLLCAGITTYSPLKQFGVKKGDRVGVVGLGGLGHMAVKIAAAMGADVTVFSTSPKKEPDAKRLGAHRFVVSKDPANLDALANQYDFILDCVSAPHDLNPYLSMLRRNGTMCLVGVPTEAASVHAFSLIANRRRLAGSPIGGIPETQEMLDFCAKHELGSDVEVIPMSQVNEAYERTIRSDVKYRFVIDMKTL